MNAIGLRTNPSAPDPIEAPECPEWLSDELHANPVFVAEAISNAPDEIAKAYIASLSRRRDPIAMIRVVMAIDAAIDAWIAHWWAYGKFDATDISRKWARWAA